jgi:hypothetical protein
MTDLDLLRQYEPVVCYTKGEMFFPAATDEFVKRASLWLNGPGGYLKELVSEGDLNPDKLAEYDEVPPNHTLYLRLVEKPLTGSAYQRWLSRPDRVNFKAAGRLARVPLWSRVFGSVLDVSLLARGAVPGGFTAAAQIEYAAGLKADPRRVYHGRVVRDGGWIVLQYLFFFYMNDWRSSFAGVNDHESDWEQIFVFLYENANGELEPRWVAYASHDFKGDDLRRRWDDPLLVKQDSHPVVFAGAGSHASYYEQGEYMVGMTPDFIKPVERVLQQARKFFYQRFSEADDHTRETPEGTRPFLSIPNIDYARGDGLRIGPGQTEEWTPLLISDEVGWVDGYRGLWGLDTRDPVGGERAPSGPKYNRDGSVRQSWYDPLGWAGLDKTLPPIDVPGELDKRLNRVEGERHTLEDEIQVKRAALRDLALDVEALRETGYLSAALKKQEKQLEADQKELQGIEARHNDACEAHKALTAYRARLTRGDVGSPTAHIRHSHHPEPSPSSQYRAVEVWAAISGALTVLALLFVFLWHPQHWLWLMVVVVLIMAGVEAATGRRLTKYLVTVTIFLAFVTSAILVVQFWQEIVFIAVGAVVVYVILDNLRELAKG